MKTKLKFLSIIVFLFNGAVWGQDVTNRNKEKSEEKSEEKSIDTIKTIKIKILNWDYKTKSFEDDKILKKLNVNDVIQIVLKHLPKDYEIKSSITFLNNHLELRGSFGQNINFSENNSYLKNSKQESILDSVKKDIEKKDIENFNEVINNNLSETKDNFLKKNKSFNKNDLKILENKISNELKINSKNLNKSLEIEIAKKFIESNKENSKAKEDIEWQEYLIKIAQKNWKNELNVRNEMIEKLSQNIDSLTNLILNVEEEVEKLKPSKTKYFAPFKVENYDFTEFSIEIKDKTIKDKPIQIPINYSFKNKGGFKLDFSTGILATGLFSPSYKLISEGSNQKKIVEEANISSKFNTGIALMAHAYRRSGSYLNWGLGSGFSYNLDSQTLNYLLGGSILWGEEQRIVTSIGLNVGKIKQLPSYYEVNKLYDKTEFSENAEVPTVDVLKASWFFSITYNLGISNPSKTKNL